MPLDKSLDKYRQKLDFTRSPEPDGSSPRRSPAGRTARAFCVQKHLASHLHYDLRLEHNGVLLSWAVPKGPTLDPATKRLAMHVEDHPIEYGEFEGVIPSGYGAGIVMLWDRGTWTPEVDDVDAALKKGDLKFTLDGYKLKGSWVLVRTRGWGSSRGDDGRSWLLIKHKDEWSGALDIAEFAPLSVKSEGDFADILAQDNPDIWRSNRPAQGGDTGKLFQSIVARALALKGKSPLAPAVDDKPKKAAPPARTAGRSKRRETPVTAASRRSAVESAVKGAGMDAVKGAGTTAGHVVKRRAKPPKPQV
jgi:bifunctional non-homologous end joining protein LigD